MSFPRTFTLGWVSDQEDQHWMKVPVYMKVKVSMSELTPQTESDADRILWRLISSALKECIQCHGAIDKNFVGSATKRVIRNIIECKSFREVCPEDLYNKMIVDSLEVYHEQELREKENKIAALKRTIQNLQKAPKPKPESKQDKRGVKILELNNEVQSLKSKLMKYEKKAIRETKPFLPIPETNGHTNGKLTDSKSEKDFRQKTEELAYKLWEVAGKPEQLDQQFWFLAEWLLHHRRNRAIVERGL